MDKSKDNSEKSESDEKLAYFIETFQEVLSPLEPTIMKLQSLLVWENPMKSTAMIAGVHCIFWYV
jgi:hypothetical protein